MIRSLEHADLPELVLLCAEHAAYERAEFEPREAGEREAGLAALFLDGAGEPRGAHCWVVEEAGELVGFATANLELSTWDGARYLHLDCLYLREGFRGRGLGRALMQRAARAALAAGAVNLQWQTPSWNARAARFYRRLGAEAKDKLRFTLDRAGCAALAEDGGSSAAPPGKAMADGYAPATTWAPRSVRPLAVVELVGWRVKPYALAWSADDDPSWEAAWPGARALASNELEHIAAKHPTPRLAALILHRGEDCWWLLVDAWVEGGMLVHQIFHAPHGAADGADAWTRVEARDPNACVWELAVLAFERDAFVEHLFKRSPGSDRDAGERAYLAARLEGTC